MHRARSIAVLVVSTVLWGGAALADPAKVISVFSDTGGDSVTGSGEWSVITEGPPACALQIYRRDYASMGWQLFQTLTPNQQATCDDGNFGGTSSIAGSPETGYLLVLGVPGWDSIGGFCSPSVTDAGGVIFYTLEDQGDSNPANDTWVRRAGGNCVGDGEVLVAGDPLVSGGGSRQEGAAYGSSVSVSQIDTDHYLVVVGEPLYHADDRGRAWSYHYEVGGTATLDSISLIGSLEGIVPNGRYGVAVTTNAPYAMLGEPGPRGDGFSGRMEVVFVDPPSTLDVSILPGQDDDELGHEVSLSDELIVVSGASEAVIFENLGTPEAPGWSPVALRPFTDGGDVSQANGVVAFGINSTSPGGGATLYRNVGTDALADDIVSDVVSDVGASHGGTFGEIGLDIRLVDESLWYANPSSERAVLYQYVCGFGVRVVAFQYRLVSIPCDTGDATVAEIFADLGILGTNYVVYRYDDSDVTKGSPYVPMTAGETMVQDRSYWLATDTSQYLYVSVTAEDDAEGVPDFTPSEPVDGTLDPTIVRQYAVPLVDPVDPDDAGPKTPFARVMVTNPFIKRMPWSEVLYDDGNQPMSLADAETAGYMLATGYVYDTGVTNQAGQNYRAISSTPGFSEFVEPYEGVWVRLLEDASAAHSLRVPQTR